MCLDAHAHGVRIEHDLFNTPNKVDLTFTDQPTPSSYARYPEGQDLGATMPMWRVQTEGYTTHEGQLIGVVSRDSGFLDSPDTEWISGGVNSKGPNAVALGRHGNFLHWGFAASPTYLTDEAKDVFVNALHYITRFDHQAPIARKSSGTMMREALDSAIYDLSPEGYAKKAAMYRGFGADEAARKDALRKRKEAGETLTEMEERILASPARPIPAQIDAAARFVSAEVIARMEGDPAKVAAYLKSIRPYMRPAGWYELSPDEDLMELGIGNADPALLDRAVALLGTEKAELGQRLLERYTEAGLHGADEWKAWLMANRERLFFTEAGGYKWLVNTVGQGPVDASAKTDLAAPKAVEAPAPRKSDVKATRRSPLDSGLTVRELKEGRFELTLEVDVLKGWHAYDDVPEGSPYTALTHTLTLPAGVTRVGEWTRPASHASHEDPNMTVFEGRLFFRCELDAPDAESAEEVTWAVRYQVCDDNMCFPPTTKELSPELID